MEFEPLSMENEVMEFDMGSGDDDEVAVDIEHPEEDEEYEDDLVDGSFGVGREVSDGEPNLEPYEGMQFESEEAARIFYNSYARRIGFGTRVGVYHRSRRDGAIICRQIVCSRQGFRHGRDRDGGSGESKSKRHRAETRVGCKAMIMVKKQDSGKWVVSKFFKEHNHELVPPDKVHCLRSHRHVSGPARSLIDTLQAAGIGPSGVMSVLIKESRGINNVGFTTVDCRNYMSSSRQRTLGSGGQHVLDYLKRMQTENPAFFYAIHGNGEHSTGNVFWVDANSRMSYKYFGDTVTFDTTYRTNRYRVPFAPFTGLNHHGQPVLFGCALLLNESESSFVWLFETWLAAMYGRRPVSITTDQDRIIRSAVAQVFPETRHRFCKWNIFIETHEKLSSVYQSQSTFEADFRKCINTTETIDEFESSWELLLQKYNLVENEWLQSMYNVRRQWVPVFLRDSFFGEMFITQGSDSMNSFFDGYVNASTTIQLLIKQYEKAMASRHEKEVKADYDTINTAPVLKTPSPMEKQAANSYTRRIFMKFQEELVETLANPATKIEDTGISTIYRVAKFGEENKVHIVRFNVFENKATCTCQMFEFSGILCRHILAVFRVSNVLTLPSHYVSKRWTRNAKSGIVLDGSALESSSNARESSTVRYNNLRQEAIKYVEEGAKSVQIYNVAMDALQEAAKKVAAAKKHGLGLALINGNNNQENHALKGSRVGLLQPHSVDEKDKKIQELTTELDNANQRCEVYRGSLLAVLKDMEEQKLQLSVKVQNVRLNLKD
ncbi:protein FAR1-RELATED SEQUENCE 5-like [Telopea speciosissima]|uniref:protein FAR1-RELATED SEQUENCE 5-like n=1 Tax=Telopea speciosissima TaxID=54955 RepID=UPI001CC5A86E|nr:protein FAR1-RELATED SEQUENCE 5-like [Telopea speciosissima]